MNESTNTQADSNPSIMAHVSIGTNRFDDAVSFYDQVLATLGAKRIVEIPGMAVAWGREFPEFWVQVPYNQQAAETANGIHFAFLADSEAMVKAFYQAGLAAGATCDGAPGPRPQYSEAYFGCFLRDLEGHKIEAMYWDFSKAPVDAA